MRTVFVCLLVCTVPLLYCAEELPPYIEPEAPLSMELGITHNPTLIWGVNNSRSVTFYFAYQHTYEEVLAENHYFRGSIDLHVADRPELCKRIEIFEDFPQFLYEIPPNELLTHNTYWNQSFDNGLYLWYFLDTFTGSFDIEATGELQVFRTLNKLAPDEIQFRINFIEPSIKQHFEHIAQPDWLPPLLRFPDYNKKLELMRHTLFKQNNFNISDRQHAVR